MKRGMQLSINIIIYVILAFVFLGIAIALMKTWMPGPIDIPHQCDLYPPTAEQPVCIQSSWDLKRGQEFTIDTAFHNDEDADITDAVTPVLTCSNSPDGNTVALRLAASASCSELGRLLIICWLVRYHKMSPGEPIPVT